MLYFARTKGAKDKRPRKSKGQAVKSVVGKGNRFQQVRDQVGSRSVGSHAKSIFQKDLRGRGYDRKYAREEARRLGEGSRQANLNYRRKKRGGYSEARIARENKKFLS